MTKHDLVVRLSEKIGVTQAQGTDAVETLLALIIDSLGREERVELRNFGVFEVRRRKPRVGRNPANPAKQYPVPARAIAKFKPGKEMAAVVAKLGATAPAPGKQPSA